MTEESIPSPTTDTRGDVVIITGLAGAGRETAAHALEDMGWYVVYNIAPQLIGTLYELQASAVGRENRFAVVVDPRSGPFFTELGEVVDELRKADLRLRLLFLTADESTLVRRFDSVRRPHPLQGEEGVLEGIRREREMLARYRRTADLVIDTSPLNVHELTMKMRSLFGTGEEQRLTVTMLSFGFSTGSRWRPTTSATCASSPTRTGCRSCVPSGAPTPTSPSSCSATRTPPSSSSGTSR